MFQNILVPLDGSRFAEHALPLATRLARSARARLHLALAHRPVPALVGVGEMRALPGDLNEELKAQEAGYLSETAERILDEGVGSVEYHEAEGLAGPELCGQATDLQADLIVMATHGRGGMRRFWLGSVADYLVRHLPTPVLLVHPGRDEERLDDPTIRGILVALDLSADSEAILEPVTALAQVTQAHVTLVHAVDPVSLLQDQREAQRQLDRLAARLRDRGLSVSARLVTGTGAAAGLLETLEEYPYDLLALTTHGAGGVRRLLLGSVADKVIRRATNPVLVMRPASVF